jgi:polar amino acid transport system permease protein
MLRYRDAFTLPAMLSAPLPGGGDQPRMLQTPPPRGAERVSALPTSRGFAWSKKAALTRGTSSPLEGEGNILRVLVIFALIVGLGATMAVAQQPAAVKATATEVLIRWAPLLLWGFGFNILISIMAMAIGTVAGVPVGIAQLSRFRLVRIAAGITTQLFRNSPWLVLLFLCVFLIPFEIRAFGLRIPFPDWAKATMGFALPVMANTSEIARGAIQSVATGQWDSARALGLTQRQCLYLVILPQCVKRMLPPWMNLYSLVAMSTVNASIVGVSEMITLTAQVHAAEGSRPELLAPLYAFALACFFVYCYPIGKWTQALERRYQVGS